MSDSESESDSGNSGRKYEVEKIIGERQNGSKKEFKVLWKGYPSSEATWEPIENLAGAKAKLKEWRSKKFENSVKVSKPINVSAVVGARKGEGGEIIYSVIGRGYHDIKEIPSKTAVQNHAQRVIDYYLENSSEIIE